MIRHRREAVLAACFVLLGCSKDPATPASGPERAPRALGLPDPLARQLADRFPHLRLPTGDDLTGGWARYPRKRGFPFLARGDFNGDRRADFALILLGPETWELVAFHSRGDGGYDALELNHFREVLGGTGPAQSFHVFTIRRGARLKVGGELQPPHPRDSIGLFYVNDAASGLQLLWYPAPDARSEGLRRLGFYSASGFNTD